MLQGPSFSPVSTRPTTRKTSRRIPALNTSENLEPSCEYRVEQMASSSRAGSKRAVNPEQLTTPAPRPKLVGDMISATKVTLLEVDALHCDSADKILVLLALHFALAS